MPGVENEMTKMSTGDDATLGNYRKMAVAVFGEDSKPVKFLDNKIVSSPDGANEEVIADERQMVYLLGKMAFSSPNPPRTDSDGGEDTDRLDWMRHNVSGKEFRRIGIQLDNTGDIDELRRRIDAIILLTPTHPINQQERSYDQR